MTGDLDGIVCNDDWSTAATDLPALVRTHKPAWFATQESKGIGGYRGRISADRYGVRQDMHTQGTQGVSVGWDRDLLRAMHGRAGQGIEHHGWRFLVDGPDLEPRGVVWQDLEVIDDGLLRRHFPNRLRLASAHRPPLRDRHLWPRFDHQLRLWMAASPYPLLLGMDSNQEGGPDPLTGRVGKRRMDWHGHRIDGVLTDLRVTGVRDLPEGSSDHHPLLVTVKL